MLIKYIDRQAGLIRYRDDIFKNPHWWLWGRGVGFDHKGFHFTHHDRPWYIMNGNMLWQKTIIED